MNKTINDNKKQKKVLLKAIGLDEYKEISPQRKRAMVNFYNLITGQWLDFNSIPINALQLLNTVSLPELCQHTIIDLKAKGKATRGSIMRLGLTANQARYRLKKLNDIQQFEVVCVNKVED